MATTYIGTAVTTHNNLRIRSEASSLSNIVIQIPSKGTEIYVIEDVDNQWYKIEYNGKMGYASKSYLTNFKKIEAATTTSTPKKTSITVTELKQMGYESIILE